MNNFKIPSSAVGRAVAATPGVSPVRQAFLRDAFRQALRDRGFIAAAA